MKATALGCNNETAALNGISEISRLEMFSGMFLPYNDGRFADNAVKMPEIDSRKNIPLITLVYMHCVN